MTQKQLEKLGETWQRRLRLQDWEVGYELVPVTEMENPSDYGATRYNHQLKRAKVQINSSREDLEDTLVHELIHLHFASLEPGEGIPHALFEQGIDCCALALTALARRGA